MEDQSVGGSDSPAKPVNKWETLSKEELIREAEKAFAEQYDPVTYWASVLKSLQRAAEISRMVRVKSYQRALENPKVR